MDKTIIMSLGGSLIVPLDIDVEFLKKFKILIEKYISKGYRFVIFCGGGKVARNYQVAVNEITTVNNSDLDWIGIHATRLNALLLKKIFKEHSEKKIIIDPTEEIKFEKNVLIGAGWKPGWSTDYDAVLIGKNLGFKEIINLSNIDHVYDKDPNKHTDARKHDNMTWEHYRSLIDTDWSAGLNSPFDPIASKVADEENMKVIIMGKDLDNLENYLEGREFKGTVLE